MFSMVNDFLVESGKEKLFDISLAAHSKEMKLDDGIFSIKIDAVLEEVKETDLVIIPPMSGDMEEGISLNKASIPWISQQYKKGAEIASLCVGAFLLAETGLLKGKECSTHWQTAFDFRRLFPDVNLVDEKIITDFNGLYTSGGSNSYWNLLVYLVEKYADRETAIRASKYFEVDLDRNSQSPFMIFEGCKSHEDSQVHLAQDFIENNYQEKISIEQLAQLSTLSRRTFQRRFKKCTHFVVVDYLQKVRVEAAKKLLETNRLSVNEVMVEVGYNDPKAFRDVFKKVSGMSPLMYKNRYM